MEILEYPLWISYGFLVVFVWFSFSFHKLSYDFCIFLLWKSYGTPYANTIERAGGRASAGATASACASACASAGASASAGAQCAVCSVPWVVWNV